ncbi:tropinone reductase homolog At2g29360-like [Miscanthus floridulus]|uniref:tropinone reductase homolog At2g29360-like n=1 Tax=Miscanthus floridulus TaxID=154761 RepID=UPI003459B15A
MAVTSGSRQERWSLVGATALVTGGSKGIGHGVVEELAGFGARVHTCARNAAELEESRRRWAEKGLVVTVSVCDVSVPADREKLMHTVKATFDGKLDILVNNAGQVFFKPAAECTAEDYSHVMATNLESSFHLCQLAHPLLVRASVAGGGSVVHISSIASYLGYPGLVLYLHLQRSGVNRRIIEVDGQDFSSQKQQDIKHHRRTAASTAGAAVVFLAGARMRLVMCSSVESSRCATFPGDPYARRRQPEARNGGS